MRTVHYQDCHPLRTAGVAMELSRKVHLQRVDSICINTYLLHVCYLTTLPFSGGTAVAQWLRCCASNRKVAVSIPADVTGFFIDIKSFRSHYGPGVDSASNRNEYQEYFLGVKVAGA